MDRLTRRAVVFAVVTGATLSQERESEAVLELLAALAEALSTANAPGFMHHVSRDFPAYDEFRRNIYALTEQWDIATSMEPLQGSGAGSERAVQVDWFVELRAKPPSNRLIRRRELATLKLVRNGTKWKLAALSPISLLSTIVPEVR